MTGSYKIALLAAGLLCLLVVGYYVMPEGDHARVSTEQTTEPDDDGRTSQPRSLVRRSPSPGGRSSQPRPSESGDAMAPLGGAPSSAGETPGTPPSEDPGVADGYGNDPVLPVARNGSSLQTNPYEPLDVTAPAEQEPEADEDADAEPTASEPSRALVIERRSQPAPTEAANDEPASQQRPSRRTSRETYTVQAGDTLSSIATDLYGAERHWVDLARANPRIDPLRLRIGQELRLPDAETIQQRSREDDLESPPGTLTHIVRPGETLSTIAQEHYNDSSRWHVIFNANRDQLGSDPDRVKAGDELTIPPLPRN